MGQKMKLARPTAKQAASFYEATTGCPPPPDSKIYMNKTPSSVRAIAEYEPMGGGV